ncbi:protein kinase [Nocardia sp. NPDC052112]|uniref:protein kinase domain-containing protein n=1 Tax=Nocardia sp. NPDC052112 TaxID=3155646 RepID=UPI0034424FD4
MTHEDPLRTRREVVTPLTAELDAVGFEDAVEIGHGGFGVVYRCWQAALDRTVAVKVLTAELDPDNQARFIREQRTMGRLTGHPNIVTVLEAGATASGRPYLVMPYHPRDSLDAWIRKHGPVSLEKTLSIGVKIAGALESAHRLDIVHRDVKPGNILLTEYGEPALTDFGIARIAGGFRTSTGTLTGSPAFTAPEVLEGETPTSAADVYGLGATLFCALTGHAAYERRSGENVVTQFLRITTQPVPDLKASGIPDDVAALVATAMNRNSHDRPSAADLGETIRQIEQHHGFAVDDMALPAKPDLEAHDERDRVPARVLPAMAAQSSGRGGGNLPLELTSFINRRTELAEAKNRLSASRLVTMTGIGGVGKTRLAMRAASAQRRDFADGAWLIELADVSDASLVVDVVAAALGVRDDSAMPLLEVLTRFLSSRETLLILDNCEQVVDAVAKLTDTLLRSCPDLRILVTSREPLNIAGESVVRVPTLTVPHQDQKPTLRGMPRFDAVTLFSDRAAAAVPGFQIDEGNKTAIAQICAHLDGLPLAIELASARLRSMSPEQILQHLDDRYSLLTRGSRSAPTRQQTLQWCIDWSYQLCTPAEQRLWARLSVFAGGFELDAAEQISGADLTPQNVLDVLSALVDKSILVRDEADSVVRFRMLETLRDYGRQKLRESGEYQQLRRRHRDWYEQLAVDAEAEWISHRQPDWIARLDREQPNLREALESFLSEDTAEAARAGLRTTAALYEFWLFRGLYGEGRSWLERALAHSDAQSIPDRVKALRAFIQMAAAHRDFRAAATPLEEAHALAEASPTPTIQAQIAHADGTLALSRGDVTRACSSLERAVKILSSQATSALHVNALIYLGWALEVRGDLTRADTYYRTLLSITEPCGELFYRCAALRGMGVAAWQQGDGHRAEQLIQNALRLNRRLKSPIAASFSLQALAWVVGGGENGERSPVLMGAAQSIWPAASDVVTTFPNTSPFHEAWKRTTRHILGARKFDAAFRRGQAMGMDAAVAYALGEQHTHPTSCTYNTLSKRERRVADLVAQGLSNKQIAAKLVISQRTAEGHVEHILTKLGFTSRAQIAAWITAEAQQ